jgi:hypothetical protein
MSVASSKNALRLFVLPSAMPININSSHAQKVDIEGSIARTNDI